jgi:hypothetical protein
MKTDRFDEEFRRKLLGLPAEADPGEVERIQGFVNANKPALPSFGWGKLLLYGGSSLLLIGSLSYNVIQNYRNTHLQSSIDSLAHRPVDQAASSEAIRHDTVYITRSGNSVESTSLSNTLVETTPQKSLEQADASQKTGTQPIGSVAMDRPKSPKAGHEGSSNQSEAVSPRSEPRPTELAPTNTSIEGNQRSEGGKLSGQVQTEANESVASRPPASVERSTSENTKPTNEKEPLSKSMSLRAEGIENDFPNGSLSPDTRASSRRSTNGRQTSSGKRQTVSGNEKNGLLATNYSRKQNQRTIANSATTGFTPGHRDKGNSSVSVPEINHESIAIEPLASLKMGTPSNKLTIISPSRPLIVPKSALSVKVTRRPWHLTMPSLSVPKAQYRLGVGLMGGSNQVGGALLGEIMLNRHWSVQSGLQLGYNQGFHYRDEQEFDEHEKEDFRQTYASRVPSSSDIEDIKQMSLLVQIPIQIAYHYPLGREWGLRLGFGTNLNVWVRSAIRYNYRENSRSAEHGLSLIEEPAYVFNNLTLSTSVERSWKKWLFRAGPFISPQLRPIEYKRDDLSWGANLQILYRLGK